MTTKTVRTYYADDGTEFDNFIDCFDYENQDKYKEFENTALIFHEFGHQMPLNSNNFKHAAYIKAVTNEAAQFMAKTFKKFHTPWNTNSYDDLNDNYPITAGGWAYKGDRWISTTELQSWLSILS